MSGRVSPARRAAFQILLRVETEGAFPAELLHAHPRVKNLAERDRALAHEIVLGCLRWQGAIDALIEPVARRPVSGLDAEVRTALRIAGYQMRFLDRIPGRAAVSESVELVKSSPRRGAAGFVNAVLRRLPSRESGPQPALAEEAERSHPAWLLDRWRTVFDESTLRRIVEANQSSPPTWLRLNRRFPAEETLRRLADEGVIAEPTDVPYAFLLVSGKPAATACWRENRVRIQDLGSQMVVPLLDLHAGHRFLDLCAAPGGKTSQAAEIGGPGLRTVAADLHLHRLATLHHLATVPVDTVALDATAPLPFRANFDRILVDAPCSGTGTLARNPDIKWRLRPEDIQDLAEKQKAILLNALELLAPAGLLVYSTCSIEPEENQQVVDAVLKAKPNFTAQQALERIPGRDPGDGFYACRIQHRRD